MSATGMDSDSRVALAEIRGDVKLVLAGQDRANSDIRDLRAMVHAHGDRLGILETRNNVSDGERKGIAMSARIGLVLLGTVPTGAAVIIMRLLNV